MKTRTSICLAAAIVIGGSFFADHLRRAPAVHAQSACDAGSFLGGYGYALSGYVYDPQGNVLLLASAGRLVADGRGSVTGADTSSQDGTIVHRTYTGTYSMNGDCTGSITLQTATGGVTAIGHGDIVAVNNAREINFVQTDSNYVFSGVFTRQNQ